MELNAKRAGIGFAAAGLAIAGLAGGGVALASAHNPAGPATPAAATAQPPAGWCLGGRDGWTGMPGRWAGQPMMTAAAAYLGMSQAELRTQLQAGQSLADLAQAHGKPVAGLENAMLAAMTSRINASSTLSAAQRAELIREMRDHMDDMVNAAYPAGPGRPGPGGGMGMWW